MGNQKTERIKAPERGATTRHASPDTQRHAAPEAPLASHDRAGNAVLGRWVRGGVARGDVRVSEPGDPQEREADRIAEHVMSAASGRRTEPSARTTPTSTPAHPVREGVGPGQPLDALVRTSFEASLGHDLSDVRIHTSPEAAETAEAFEAHAFAAGSDIAFARGAWAPDTTGGRRLLAHEIAHTLQRREASDRTVHRQADPEPTTSQPSEVEQHLRRQYPRLADALSLDDWLTLQFAAEKRAAKQEAHATSVGGTSAVSIQMPLEKILDPRARFVDVDIWDQLFDLFYRGDQSSAAGILLRNEVARHWFQANVVKPEEKVTISLIDPEGLQAGPAQFDFLWRKKAITDTLGAIEIEWLDEVLRADLMVLPLRTATLEAEREAKDLAQAAMLKREKEEFEKKLPPVIAQAQRTLKKATLGEVETYNTLVQQGFEQAGVLEDRANPRAAQYIPGVYAFYKENARTLSILTKELRAWTLGTKVIVGDEESEANPAVLEQPAPSDIDVMKGKAAISDVPPPQRVVYDESDVQQRQLSYREILIRAGWPVHDVSETERLFVAGEISLQAKEDLDEAMARRIFYASLVNIALGFLTLPVGGWVAEGIGLAEGTVGYGVIQVGVSGAITEVGTKATEGIITSTTHLEDPRAQKLWEAGLPTIGDYFKAAGLGFIKGASLALVFSGAAALWQGYKTWKAARINTPDEPPITVLSETFDPLSGVRTWQLRTIDGELVTISAQAETGSGYLWRASTGELRQIVNGEIGKSVLMLKAGSEHAEVLAELQQLLVKGPPRPAATVERVEAAMEAFRARRGTVEDLEVVFHEIVADYRATRIVGKPPGGVPGVLDYRTLRDCCGQGRDITAASLATIANEAGTRATIRRFQSLDVFVGVPETRVPALEQHSFSVVEFEALPGELFLVDPTFAQFLKPRMFGTGGPLIPLQRPVPWESVGAGEGFITGNILKTDLAGARFARDLVRDGFVKLDLPAARLYVRAMSVPEAQVEEMASRLMNGERVLLTETVGPGAELATGPIAHGPDWGPVFTDLNGVEQEVTRLTNQAEAVARGPDFPGRLKILSQLPRLQELQRRVQEAMSGDRIFWDPAIHGPEYEAFTPPQQ